MIYLILSILVFVIVVLILNGSESKSESGPRTMSRREYYNEVYLKSDAWRRKRYVVLKRDNWTCVYCGSKATQVHHKKYAKYNIGKEPIDWLVSVCKPCHDAQHH
jgi:5-methylcytosine-specific restriction endonuclease McrA